MSAGKTNRVLVTGADRGLGMGFVRHYLEQGSSVVATTRRVVVGDDLGELAERYADRLDVEFLDLGEESSILTFGNVAASRGWIFDVVISNAGVTVTSPFGEWSADVFQSNLTINTVGPALLVQALRRCLVSGTRVVQISSGMGSLELNIDPDNELDAYAVSKCGLNLLTRRLAEKLRSHGISVVSLNPGWVRTEMGGSEAPVSVGDAVAEMTATIGKLSLEHSGDFLASDGSRIPW